MINIITTVLGWVVIALVSKYVAGLSGYINIVSSTIVFGFIALIYFLIEDEGNNE